VGVSARICHPYFDRISIHHFTHSCRRLLFAALAASGCESTDQPVNGAAAPAVERGYRTGSNIALRDAKPLTKEEREKQAEAIRPALENTQKGGYSGRQ
jgi:hypothetical protein